MNDQELWRHGIEKCSQLHGSLPSQVQAECGRLLEQVMRCKTQLMALVSSSGSGERCRQCGGECCLYGKYHVTLIEVLASLHSKTPLPDPDFTSHPCCPYSNSSGCLMNESIRPTTCVIFNCEKLESAFTPGAKVSLERLENELRQTVSQLNTLVGMRLDRPLLLWSGEPVIDSRK